MVRKAILIPSSAPKPKSICSRQAARNVFFSPVPYSPQLKSSMHCVFETGLFLSPAHDSDLVFLSSVLSAAPLDPVRAGGRRRENLLFAEWALGPNGNLCLLQQSNPEAGGILN